jgi:hypothetical protein
LIGCPPQAHTNKLLPPEPKLFRFTVCGFGEADSARDKQPFGTRLVALWVQLEAQEHGFDVVRAWIPRGGISGEPQISSGLSWRSFRKNPSWAAEGFAISGLRSGIKSSETSSLK